MGFQVSKGEEVINKFDKIESIIKEDNKNVLNKVKKVTFIKESEKERLSKILSSKESISEELLPIQSYIDGIKKGVEITSKRRESQGTIVDKTYLNHFIGIKLLIISSEIPTSKFWNDLLYMTGYTPDYGMFHTALLVGPWLIDWTDKSLVIPKEVRYTNRPFLILDIPSTYQVKDIELLQKKIAEFSVDWNLNKTYSEVSCNCQQFTESLCEYLGLELKLSKYEVYNSFLLNLKKKGKSELLLPIRKKLKDILNDEIIKEFIQNENQIIFQNHFHLDSFMLKIKRLGIEKQINLQEEFKEEFQLLKGFDRAFWLKYFNYSNKLKGYKDILNGIKDEKERQELLKIIQQTEKLIDECKNHDHCFFENPLNTSTGKQWINLKFDVENDDQLK